MTSIAYKPSMFLQYSGTQSKIFFTNLVFFFFTLITCILNELTQQEMLVGNNYRSETANSDKVNGLSKNILIEWSVFKLGM